MSPHWRLRQDNNIKTTAPQWVSVSKENKLKATENKSAVPNTNNKTLHFPK